MTLASRAVVMSGSTTSNGSSNGSIREWLDRARRQRLRGEQRKALLILREACCRYDDDARLWAIYGVQCWRMGRRDDGRDALRQALWLREQEQDHQRAHVLRGLLLAMESALAAALVVGARRQRSGREVRHASSACLALNIAQ